MAHQHQQHPQTPVHPRSRLLARHPRPRPGAVPLLARSVLVTVVVAAVGAALATAPVAGRPPGHVPLRAVAQTTGTLGATTTGTFWVSSPTDPTRRLRTLSPTAGPATSVVAVDPAQPRQTWWGTGAALTDASVGLLNGNAAAVRQLYAPSLSTGAHLNMLRLPLSATDFSPQPWSWSWDGRTATPAPQQKASVALVRGAIMKQRPDLRVVTAPWTAPAAMKTTGSLRGGALLAGQEASYAALLSAQVTWLKAQGVPVWATTVVNEPGYSTDYPSMRMTDDQLSQVGRGVDSSMRSLGVRLWALDHNWSDAARVQTALDGAPGAFAGAAYHCYGGTPAEMAVPDVPRMVTECTGTTDGWSGTFAWDARNLVAGAIAAGSSGLMMWNLALDAQSGPVDTGSQWGCKNCRGLLTVTPAGITRGPEFFTLAHLSRAASPGARVVAATATPGLETAAFSNPDGTVGVFGHNSTGIEQVVQLAVAGGATTTYTVEPGELFTYRSP
ncbi:MAG: glycoside hydrolase family 30 protein [Nocardioides sp.]